MNIKDLIIKTEKVNWQELKDLQPNNLKAPYHSNLTKQSLIKNGFAFTFYVWEDKQGNKYVIDGHLRKDLLIELKNDGYEIPDLLNCTFLDLPDRKTAVRYLLEVFNTKKNPMDELTMFEWVKDEEVEDVSLDWLDIQTTVKDEEINFDNIESTADRKKEFKNQLVTCPHCEGSFNIQV